MKLKKFRLTLDVAFDAATVNAPVLRGHLEQVVKDAVSNGTLTGDSPATVERYTFKVTEIRRRKKIKKKSNVVHTIQYKGYNIYICEDASGLYGVITNEFGAGRGNTPYRHDLESIYLIAKNMIDKF